jgi:hypothetical protein
MSWLQDPEKVCSFSPESCSFADVLSPR